MYEDRCISGIHAGFIAYSGTSQGQTQGMVFRQWLPAANHWMARMQEGRVECLPPHRNGEAELLGAMVMKELIWVGNTLLSRGLVFAVIGAVVFAVIAILVVVIRGLSR